MRKLAALACIMILTTALFGCESIFKSKSQELTNFKVEALKAGQGAVLMHAINYGSLCATRWVKIDNQNIKQSLTAFHSNRHNFRDNLGQYDLVMLPPGTYALYSVYSNCPDGLRPVSTDWDETIREDVSTPLGMISQIKHWDIGSVNDLDVGVGIGGGNSWGHGSGVGFGVGLGGGIGGGVNPGMPESSCNLINKGVRNGKPILASITVRPGEIVYAGEIDFDFTPDANCFETGNPASSGDLRLYCGAAAMRLSVSNAWHDRALPFLEKTLGPELAAKTVTRLAEPGSMVKPMETVGK